MKSTRRNSSKLNQNIESLIEAIKVLSPEAIALFHVLRCEANILTGSLEWFEEDQESYSQWIAELTESGIATISRGKLTFHPAVFLISNPVSRI